MNWLPGACTLWQKPTREREWICQYSFTDIVIVSSKWRGGGPKVYRWRQQHKVHFNRKLDLRIMWTADYGQNASCLTVSLTPKFPNFVIDDGRVCISGVLLLLWLSWSAWLFCNWHIQNKVHKLSLYFPLEQFSHRNWLVIRCKVMWWIIKMQVGGLQCLDAAGKGLAFWVEGKIQV